MVIREKNEILENLIKMEFFYLESSEIGFKRNNINRKKEKIKKNILNIKSDETQIFIPRQFHDFLQNISPIDISEAIEQTNLFHTNYSANPLRRTCEYLLKIIQNMEFYTIDSHAIKNIKNQKRIFYYRLYNLIEQETTEPGHLVFRGEKKSRLREILTKDSDEENDHKLYGNLFYFGEKAKDYYSSNIDKKSINIFNEITNADVLFDNLKTCLSKKEQASINRFRMENEDLYNFFHDEKNKDLFIRAINGNHDFIFYYNMICHTLGNIDETPSKCLSSTDSLRVARFFASSKEKKRNPDDEIIILYALPDDFTTIPYALPAFSKIEENIQKLENEILNYGLKVFSGKYAFPKQKEWVLTCGMLPQLIYGVLEISHKKIFINPHMFDCAVDYRSLYLDFDQSDFDNRLTETNYLMSFEFDRKNFTDNDITNK